MLLGPASANLTTGRFVTIYFVCFIPICAGVGGTAVLPCGLDTSTPGRRVVVTWLRWPQLTVLSSGRTVFTSSSRVRVGGGAGKGQSKQPSLNCLIQI